MSRPHGRGSGGAVDEGSAGRAPGDRSPRRPASRREGGAPSSADRAALVEQRDFLLASLDDLDRELAAGDIDEVDYQALRDDYTARAAAVLLALERHDPPPSAEQEPSPGGRRVRTLAISAVVVVLFAVAAGIVIANNFGERTAGEALISDEPTSNRAKVSQAQQLEASGDPDALAEAAALYDEVLDADPENVDALTYKGWLLVRAGIPEGMDLLDQAIALRPGFAPPHVFKAVGLRNQGEPEAALAELDQVDPAQLSAFAGLVANLRQELEAQVAEGDTADGAGAASTTVPATTAP